MKKIGIIGGGQLGKMMILDAKRLGIFVMILDPTPNCPAHSIADRHMIAAFDDEEAICELAASVDIVTYELEHISVTALKKIEQMGKQVYPTSRTLELIQNKQIQKAWLQQHGVPVADFWKIEKKEDLVEIGNKAGYPIVLKTCQGGYDGKGNALIQSEDEIEAAYRALGAGAVSLFAEQFIPLEKEISVLVCRSTNGEIAYFPIAENQHKNQILDETIVPARISKKLEKEAVEIAKTVVQLVEAYGILCIEFFVTKQGILVVNELAPRPHNSGHYTIEGCVTSQYENHIRAILDLPLGSTRLLSPVVMKNIIGEQDGLACVKGLSEAYAIDQEIKIHIYGKTKVSKGRKMGHITATADTIESALNKVRKAHEQLQICAKEES